MGSYHSTPNFDPNDATRSYGNPDWMDRLDDNLIVSAVSIPGTHHSASWPSTTKQKCQVWNIEKQLSNGIRFLDIHCRCMDDQNDLRVCYTEAQGLQMRDVLDTCLKYLQLHPREFIMMRVKEFFSSSNSLGVGVGLSSLINRNPGFFWSNDRLPIVREARGKVIIMKDFNGTEYMGVPYSYDHVSDNGVGNNVQASSIDAKMEQIMRNMNSAEVGLSRDVRNLYITFSSGASSNANFMAVAGKINPLLNVFLETNRGKRVWGYVVMDFPGQSLINGIILSNFSSSVGPSSDVQPPNYEAVMEESNDSKPPSYEDAMKFWRDRENK